MDAPDTSPGEQSAWGPGMAARPPGAGPSPPHAFPGDVPPTASCPDSRKTGSDKTMDSGEGAAEGAGASERV